MAEIKYDSLVQYLIEAVPELRSHYESWYEEMGEDFGPHVVYGDVLNPYLLTLLKSEGHEHELQRIFSFLERLASSDNARIREVVEVTVCERLGDHTELLAKARKYMGAATLRISHEIEKYLGRE